MLFRSVSQSRYAVWVGWVLWKLLRSYGIDAVPCLFTHDSQDWDVKIGHLRAFTIAARSVAVDLVEKRFGVPAEIDFDIGIYQSHMMALEKAEHFQGGTKFEFKCPETTFARIVQKMKSRYDVEFDIEKMKVVRESADELFMTRRAYSAYIGTDVKHLSGHITFKDKVK